MGRNKIFQVYSDFHEDKSNFPSLNAALPLTYRISQQHESEAHEILPRVIQQCPPRPS